MPLDPQVQAFLKQAAVPGAPALHELPVPQVRELVASMMGANPNSEAVGAVSNLLVPGPGGEIPIRVYLPRNSGPVPVLVYFHGGGWVAGNVDAYDATCRALTNAAACAVVSVEYRLAPEHKFPAAPDDCYAAVKWVAANAAQFGGDASRLAVGGDSAGGNLTTVVAHMARDRGGPPLQFQLLIYPVTDHNFGTGSYQQNADGYLLTRDAMKWFWNHYLREEADASSPLASPLRSTKLAGLPPAFVITAEFDPLRDEGEAYGERLVEAGVPTVVKRYDGMIHGFFSLGVFDQGRQAIADAAASLRKAFAG
ncbi:MAG: lipase [Acidobacteria bacterium]|nr:MAG: lipase [Acidobacteriota bacterium]PYR50778.1 MAG: lipase [Acidobacteriota bacterium]